MAYAIEQVDIPWIVRDSLKHFTARTDLKNKSTMIYSAGVLTGEILHQGLIDPATVSAVIDRAPKFSGQSIAGIKIIPPEEINNNRPDIIIILSPRFHESIYAALQPDCKSLGIELIDACGTHPTYERFPGISLADFPSETIILSDFLPCDERRSFRCPADLAKLDTLPAEVLLCYESDQALAVSARELIDLGIKFRGYGNAHGSSWDASPDFEAPQGFCPNVMFKDDLIRQAILKSRELCARWDICHHFDVRDFGNLLQFIRETSSLAGDYVEIGVYRGTSAVVAATYMKLSGDKRHVWLLDTYEGFSYTAAKESADAVWSGTHLDTSQDFVASVVGKTGKKIKTRKVNIVEDKLPEEIKQIGIVNIDVDLYEAIHHALFKVAPLVVRGGMIICEDYGHTPGLAGAELAVREFLQQRGDQFIKLYFESGQLCLIRR